MATLLIHPPMPVHSLDHPLLLLLLKFLVSVAGKVPHGQLELGTRVLHCPLLPTIKSSGVFLYICTVDSALDNRLWNTCC